ncbi:MAG: glycogen debranching protein [Sphingobacteriales bacterium]|nr:MAG: glycogen debranching protein [Sphingobacteriales bacterium]
MKKINLLLIVAFTINFCFAQKNKKAIYTSKEFSIYANALMQGKSFVAKAVSDSQIISNYASFDKPTLSESALQNWKLSKDISAFAQYNSSFPISNAIYNLSLEEMIKAVETDSTFRTGIDWPGVWTRDISYSIILSMAMVQPKVAMNSLLKKVNANGRIIQDTGTGGSYPVSTDRVIWAVAAWEVYKVTGDKDWLNKVYVIIKKTLRDDTNNLIDITSGLVRGESSFLDWREQTYPVWMQPVDIYASENLSTNVVHCKAYAVMVEMAKELALVKDEKQHSYISSSIRKSINKHLWMQDKGYYAQYRYGRIFKSISPKADALGEGLSVLFNVANDEQQKTVVANTPVTAFGIPCIYPQIPDMQPYHNNAVWPFVQSFWALAAAKVDNEKAVLESIAAIYRPAALFLTNKENFVATNGDFAGTAINSSNMLWSLSGNLSIVYRLLFGMDFKANSLQFNPFVPKAFADNNRTLTNFKYRNSNLDITMVGFGKIRFMLLDDELISNNQVPANLTGKHKIKIVLTNTNFPESKINKVGVDFTPQTPTVTYKNNCLNWLKVNEAANYTVIKNGEKLKPTQNLEYAVNDSVYTEYQVLATNNKNQSSFASEPIVVVPPHKINIYQVEDSIPPSDLKHEGFTGKGFVEISKDVNTEIKLNLDIKADGYYAIDFRYANGNGEIGQDNKAALRSLYYNNDKIETIVFPQRGKNEWNNWGFTNAGTIFLREGLRHFSLKLLPANKNMNIDINQAMLDYVRVTKMD